MKFTEGRLIEICMCMHLFHKIKMPMPDLKREKPETSCMHLCVVNHFTVCSILLICVTVKQEPCTLYFMTLTCGHHPRSPAGLWSVVVMTGSPPEGCVLWLFVCLLLLMMKTKLAPLTKKQACGADLGSQPRSTLVGQTDAWHASHAGSA